MPTEVRIEHRYPESRRFLLAHGADALAILHDLLALAEIRDGHPVAQTSLRQIAERLPFLSKDTAHRRLRQPIRAGVVRVRHPARNGFRPPTYVIDLTGTGISLAAGNRRQVSD